MSSDFTGSGSFDEDSARPGYNSLLSSQRFDSLSNYAETEPAMEGSYEEEELTDGGGDVVARPPPTELISEGVEYASSGPILPPPAEMEAEEGYALGEWRRENAIRLEEKERKEKEMLKAIIEEADAYKAEYYKKWKIRCENSRAVNREKEKLFVEGREKFHAEANNSYWKAIAELIPKEIPVMEKKGKKVDKEKKPSIVVIQGPKPGKPTDLSRLRQILVKLKHKPPGHMMPPPHITNAKTQENQGVSAIA